MEGRICTGGLLGQIEGWGEALRDFRYKDRHSEAPVDEDKLAASPFELLQHLRSDVSLNLLESVSKFDSTTL